uniref:Ephrin RBD domain-containing protein n=1 Tax=Syphacia muris TaxID=451379 RepID=A0A0N5ARV3_9BILA
MLLWKRVITDASTDIAFYVAFSDNAAVTAPYNHIDINSVFSQRSLFPLCQYYFEDSQTDKKYCYSVIYQDEGSSTPYFTSIDESVKSCEKINYTLITVESQLENRFVQNYIMPREITDVSGQGYHRILQSVRRRGVNKIIDIPKGLYVGYIRDFWPPPSIASAPLNMPMQLQCLSIKRVFGIFKDEGYKDELEPFQCDSMAKMKIWWLLCKKEVVDKNEEEIVKNRIMEPNSERNYLNNIEDYEDCPPQNLYYEKEIKKYICFVTVPQLRSYGSPIYSQRVDASATCNKVGGFDLLAIENENQFHYLSELLFSKVPKDKRRLVLTSLKQFLDSRDYERDDYHATYINSHLIVNATVKDDAGCFYLEKPANSTKIKSGGIGKYIMIVLIILLCIVAAGAAFLFLKHTQGAEVEKEREKRKAGIILFQNTHDETQSTMSMFSSGQRFDDDRSTYYEPSAYSGIQ